jgi:sugar diacid utilization regulator
LEFLDAFGDVSEAVESGAGLPEVARATSRALDASVAVVDSAGSVLAVACASREDERAVLALEGGAEALPLLVAKTAVGELRFRARGEPPPDALLRMVGSLIALEVQRSQAPERASEAAVAAFLSDLLGRKVTDRENIVARGHELGVDLAGGASVVVARARPRQPEEGDWRARVLAIAERGARAVARGSLAAAVDLIPGWRQDDGGNHAGEQVIVVPGADADLAARAADAVRRELESNLEHYAVAVARSRVALDPIDLHRAGAEALLAANVAEAQGKTLIAFEETGAYRLLLPAMSEDPGELRRFHEETVAPLVAYDEQYETELVRTLETFLDCDGNVANTAQKLFTHRHTVRYRLERVKELTGLDVGSTDGRERLGLGLKAMRVLGILPHDGPATEPGAEAGRVPREEKDR